MPSMIKHDICSLLGGVKDHPDRSQSQLEAERSLNKFLEQNSDLPEGEKGFHVRPWIDLLGRVRISCDYPSNTIDPSLKRSWKKLLSQWLSRAVSVNDRNQCKKGDYPPPLLQWLKMRDRLEQLKRLAKQVQDKGIIEEMREASQHDGASYQDLANSLNAWLEQNLSSAFELENDLSPQWAELGKDHLKAAREAMVFFNIAKEVQATCVEEARLRYGQGLSVFDQRKGAHRRIRKGGFEGPITVSKVVAKIRKLQEADLLASF